jgi:hypothetical protein
MIRMVEEREPTPVATTGRAASVTKVNRPLPKPQPEKPIDIVPTPAVILTDVPVDNDAPVEVPEIDPAPNALEPTTSPEGAIPSDPSAAQIREPARAVPGSAVSVLDS